MATSNRNRMGYRLPALAVVIQCIVLVSSVQASGPGVHGRVFALDSGGDIVGVVSAASIELTDQAGSSAATATTDSAGYYMIDISPGTYSYKVQAAGFQDEWAGRGIQLQLTEGYAVYNFSLVPEETTKPAEATQQGAKQTPAAPPPASQVELGTIEGRVVERKPDGSLVGLTGATVGLRQVGGSAELTRVITGQRDGEGDGGYQLQLGTGSWETSAVAAGFLVLHDPNPIEIEPGQTSIRDFILERRIVPLVTNQGIKGAITVDDPSLSPGQVPPIEVQILSAEGQGPLTLQPDDQGEYSQDLPAGRYQVVARAPQYQPVRSPPRLVVSGKYTIVDLTLRPAPVPQKPQLANLRVVVYEALDDDVVGKRELPGATVFVRKVGEPADQGQRGTTDVGGQVRVTDLTAGRYQVLARMQDYEPEGTEVDVLLKAPNITELVLKREAGLPPPPVPKPVLVAEVFAFTEDDVSPVTPLPGASLMVRLPQWPLSDALRATSDKQGDATIELDQLGTYQILAQADGYLPKGAEVPVNEAGEHRVRIVFARAKMTEPSVEPIPPKVPPTKQPRILVKVVTRDEQRTKIPVEGARVEVKIDEKTIASGVSDAQGRFQSEPIPPAPNYYVAASRAGLQSSGAETSLGDKDVLLELVLGRGSSPTPPTVTEPPKKEQVRLVVQVLASDARGRLTKVPGADVQIYAAGRPTGQQQTNRSGLASFELNRAGYEIRVNAQGYPQKIERIDLSRGDVSTQILLRRSGVEH